MGIGEVSIFIGSLPTKLFQTELKYVGSSESKPVKRSFALRGIPRYSPKVQKKFHRYIHWKCSSLLIILNHGFHSSKRFRGVYYKAKATFTIDFCLIFLQFRLILSFALSTITSCTCFCLTYFTKTNIMVLNTIKLILTKINENEQFRSLGSKYDENITREKVDSSEQFTYFQFPIGEMVDD